jgi:putative aldouronate transport system permease protein
LMKRSDDAFFDIAGYTGISVIALLCLLPFLLILSGSITEESLIVTKGYSIIPSKISFEAYRIIFKAPEKILRAYLNSIVLTFTGSAAGLFLTSMTAFVLQMKDFRYRNHAAFYFYFTTLFSGGLPPTYILMVKTLGLKDSYLALFLPVLMNVWYLLIMRNFFKTLPYSIYESAKMDGAGYFRIFINIAIPVSKPALAAIGLFIALNYWNDWYHAMLYINNTDLYPLQYFLYRLIVNARFTEAIMRGARVSAFNMPQESMKMAMAIIVTGPVVFLYPFVQKYFVKGLTIGAVKG